MPRRATMTSYCCSWSAFRWVGDAWSSGRAELGLGQHDADAHATNRSDAFRRIDLVVGAAPDALPASAAFTGPFGTLRTEQLRQPRGRAVVSLAGRCRAGRGSGRR